MPNRREPTTFKCRWRPNRSKKRLYTENDLARIICQAKRRPEDPVSLVRIQTLVQTRCPEQERRSANSAELAQAASQALLDNNFEHNQAWELFNAINLGLGIVAALLRFVPARIAGRAGALGIVALRNSIVTRQTHLVNRVAANDRLFDMIQVQTRQGAANDAFFRLTGSR